MRKEPGGALEKAVPEGVGMMFTITTLCENTVPISQGLVGEHGLSFLIESEDGSFLFDTGQGIGLESNAKKLGKDLSCVSRIILSHGHYDHTGGLESMLETGKGLRIVAHPDIFQEKVGVLPGREPVKIGITLERGTLEERAELVLTQEPHRIEDTVLTTGEVPMKTPFESIDPGLLVQKGGELVRDELLDDLSLILRTASGLVVVVGCSHRGIVNIIEHARRITKEDNIRAVLGGMHLERASEEQLAHTISYFESLGSEKIVMSHCSGLEASSKVKNALGDRVVFNRVGATFEF